MSTVNFYIFLFRDLLFEFATKIVGILVDIPFDISTVNFNAFWWLISEIFFNFGEVGLILGEGWRISENSLV